MNDHGKKKIAPIVVTVFVVAYLLIYLILVLFMSQLHPAAFLLAIPVAALAAAMVYVLYRRMKEIDGGEEDDLSNY